MVYAKKFLKYLLDQLLDKVFHVIIVALCVFSYNLWYSGNVNLNIVKGQLQERLGSEIQLKAQCELDHKRKIK